MPATPSLPLPPWLLVAEFAAAALLGAGLLIRFASATGDGLLQAAAWTLVIFGSLGLLASTAALVRHVLAVAASRTPR